MHERYALASVLFSAMAGMLNSRYILLYFAVSVAFVGNIIAVLNPNLINISYTTQLLLNPFGISLIFGLVIFVGILYLINEVKNANITIR